ncbi:hypothetical protein GCM10027160_28890 [Streptomyces calidiresistens]|uniref:Uncharacterized protein n=1 Tax=Streptomyces calidiresistens TaxID=1485586 RepID=A0A7W3T0B9_9ACTN|nr:hypothetical protein [Streptomyces calidiresistens]MBB0228508.1 hypothetical protein [Streptomyces calidiresistens]
MTRWVPGMRVTAGRANGILMDWTPLTDLGTWQGSFGPNSSFVPRMRKILDRGTPVWEFEGDIDLGSVSLNSTHQVFVFSAGHRVSSTKIYAQGGNSVSYSHVWVQFIPAGGLNVGIPNSGSSSGATRVCLAGLRITNP